MAILSIQSHVAYGYVGNKAAVYPLQNMGYDVWPVHTVHFSNHTGYGTWQGEMSTGEGIQAVVDGICALGVAHECEAILSGYMGSADICSAVYNIVTQFKSQYPSLIYLCDPVIGNTRCFVKSEVSDFFRHHLKADIITPNQFEAEFFSGVRITNEETLKRAVKYFHDQGIPLVVITGISMHPDQLHTASSANNKVYVIENKSWPFRTPIHGTGDLFSAAYLGAYLKDRDHVQALQHAVYCVEAVLENNYALGKEELQVLSIDYKKTHPTAYKTARRV